MTGWVFSGRQWHFRRLEELQRDQTAHRFREMRYQQLLSDLATLRGIDLVCCTFPYPERHPLGGYPEAGTRVDETGRPARAEGKDEDPPREREHRVLHGVRRPAQVDGAERVHHAAEPDRDDGPGC